MRPRITPAATGAIAPAGRISLPPGGAISLESGNDFDMIAPPLRHFEPLKK
jgi:hypothetical protein